MGNDQTLNELKRRLAAGELTQAQFDRLQAAILARFGDESDGDYQPPSGTRLDNLHAGLELGPPDDRYRLVKRIGRGGMGHVWLARALTEEHLLGKECVKALKLVHPQLQDDRPALERLKREAVRAKELNQEHIVNVFGWRQGADGWLFVVMEYLEGQDLALRLHQAGGQGLPAEEIRRLLPPMAAALDYAHGRKVLHRDLKPANVFLCTDGTVKLLDFGLAAELHSSASALKTGDTSGTCEYMAPEAHHGAAPTRAQDIYALTVVICELLIGRPPFTCAAAVNRRPGSLPKPDERLSDTVWQVLERGLAYNAKDRPASAKAFVSALVTALNPPAEVAPADPPPDNSQHSSRLLAGGLTLAAAMAAAWWNLLSPTQHPAPTPPASFRVNYLYRDAQSGNLKPILPGTVLHSGDTYKVIFTPDREGYVYLFQLDSSGQFFTLFPMADYQGQVLQNLNPVRADQTYAIPAKDKVFKLDQMIGKERLYLVFSPTPQRELETLAATLDQARRRQDQLAMRDVNQSLTETLSGLQGRGVASIETDQPVQITWNNEASQFDFLSRRLENLCPDCVYGIEFEHR